MIFAYLAARPALFKGAAVVAALIALMLAVAWWKGREEADDTRNQQIGAQVEQGKQAQATVENIKEANNARDEIKQATPAGDVARYNQCLRTARTPTNCKRFLPASQADKR